MNKAHSSHTSKPTKKVDARTQGKLFGASCAADLARMLIEVVDEDSEVAKSAHDKLFASVSSKVEFAETLLRAFPERLNQGLADVYAAARKTVRS